MYTIHLNIIMYYKFYTLLTDRLLDGALRRKVKLPVGDDIIII